MSSWVIKGALQAMDSWHTMSTVLPENGFNTARIEMQWAHVDKNHIRGTYNHALYISQRREMMQWYADLLYPNYGADFYSAP